MGGTGKKNEPPAKGDGKKDDGKSKKPPSPPIEDEEPEDGDFATPKRDRDGNDDEPV